MADLQKRGEQFDKTVSWLERAHTVLKYIGVSGRFDALLTLAIAAGWGALVKFVGHMPFWISVPSFLLMAVLALRFYVELRKALALRGIKTLNIQQLGRECILLRDDILDWVTSRHEGEPEQKMIALAGNDPEDRAKFVQEQWHKQVAYSKQTSAKLAEKFASRVIAICHLLQLAGIKIPDLWAFDHAVTGIAAYIGAVGELLERGLLEDARSLDPDAFRNMLFSLR